jgi:hypothetical protein
MTRAALTATLARSSGVLQRGSVVVGACGLAFALAVGCRCGSGDAPRTTPAAALRTVSRCVRGSGQLTLSPSVALPDRAWDDVVDLPFSVEVGVGAALAGDFYVTALRSESHGSSVLLARLGKQGEESELIELARVRDDAAPARVAGRDSELVVALLESAGGGRKLKLGSVQRPALPTSVRWGAELAQGNDESSAFDLALGEASVVVTWDDWDASGKQGDIRTAAWSRGSLGVPPRTGIASAPGHDAEAPRVVARPGGYWLAWLVNAPQAGGAKLGERATPAAGGQHEPDESAGQDPLVSSQRWIELVPLDAAGAKSGEVLRVTPPGRRVLGFDLATGPDGSAWLAWREDAPSVLAPGGRVVLGVAHDGATSEHVIEEEDVGAGVPTWLAQDVREGTSARWLAFAGRGDAARILVIERPEAPPAALPLGKGLREASALAVQGNELLFAAPSARSVVLSVATCGEVAIDAGVR